MGAIYNSVCKLSLLTSVIMIYQCYTEHYTLNISRQTYCLCYFKKILSAEYSVGSFFLIFIFTLFYFIILYWFCHTLTWIHHGCTWVPNPEPPSHLSPHIISLGHPSVPAPSILYPVSNLDWQFVSYMIVYMFQYQPNIEKKKRNQS